MSERTPDSKQPNEMTKRQDRRVRASTVARNVTSCGSAKRHGAKNTRTARVQATIAQRRSKPDTQQSWGRPRTRGISSECPSGPSPADQQKDPSVPTHPAARLSEREDARQQTTQRNDKTRRQKGESQRHCTECHELRQCQEARGEHHKNSTSSSDQRTAAVNAAHPVELGSPTYPRN